MNFIRSRSPLYLLLVAMAITVVVLLAVIGGRAALAHDSGEPVGVYNTQAACQEKHDVCQSTTVWVGTGRKAPTTVRLNPRDYHPNAVSYNSGEACQRRVDRDPVGRKGGCTTGSGSKPTSNWIYVPYEQSPHDNSYITLSQCTAGHFGEGTVPAGKVCKYNDRKERWERVDPPATAESREAERRRNLPKPAWVTVWEDAGNSGYNRYNQCIASVIGIWLNGQWQPATRRSEFPANTYLTCYKWSGDSLYYPIGHAHFKGTYGGTHDR